jgi:DNA-binding CsgD family transcriptional regulator
MSPVAARRDLACLTQLLTSGIDLMTQMPLTAELLRRVVPAFSLSMIRVDESCAPAEHYSEYFDEFSHRLFDGEGHRFAANPDDPAAFGALLRNPRPIGSLIDTTPEFVAGATYQHLFKRNGIHHVLDVAIREGRTPLGILGIFREARAPAFTRADLVPVAALYPALVHAFRAEPLPAEFDETESALIVARVDGSIEWASPAARRWLDDTALGRARARLGARDGLPGACAALCRRLVAIQAGSVAEPEVPTTTLPVPGGRLRLRAYGLAPAAGEPLDARCGIQLSLEMHRGLRVLRALEHADLTPQQRRIAFAYFQGRSTEEIGGLLGVRASSLKTYRKELYGRLNVGSHAELVAALHAQARAVSLDLGRHRPRDG